MLFELFDSRLADRHSSSSSSAVVLFTPSFPKFSINPMKIMLETFEQIIHSRHLHEICNRSSPLQPDKVLFELSLSNFSSRF